MSRTNTWKAVERSIASLIGGKRVPVSGRQRGESPDIAHNWLSIEVKHRRKLPKWIHDALDQAIKSVRGNQLPVAILHQKGQRFNDAFVVVRLSDFRDWFGDLTVPAPSPISDL